MNNYDVFEVPPLSINLFVIHAILKIIIRFILKKLFLIISLNLNCF